MYILITYPIHLDMTNPTSELASFIIDLEDEECPNFALHLAAYQVANI